jgi:hypothetical protein
MCKPWVSTVAKALTDARLLRERKGNPNLLSKVTAMATVLAARKGSRVALHARSAAGGVLKQVAIPLSSNYEAWYHRTECANHAVHPVRRIDPRRVTVSMVAEDQELSRAIAAVKGTLMYFVHTYSKSNSRLRVVQCADE